MRAKHSPTICGRYVDRLWWNRNGGGFGLLADGTAMSDRYQDFDHEGFDHYGYDRFGKDRVGNTLRRYEADPELYAQVMAEFEHWRPEGRGPGDYWPALDAITAAVSQRFPQLPTLDPQDPPVTFPHIRRYRMEHGAYGVRLCLAPEAGRARFFDVRFDDGVGGESAPGEWSVNCVTQIGGVTRSSASAHLDQAAMAVSHALADFEAFDPDHQLHDVRIVEAGDGKLHLQAFPRGSSVSADGDLMGSVYAGSTGEALEVFAVGVEAGGPMWRMAQRGLARLRALNEVDHAYRLVGDASANLESSPVMRM